MLTGKLVLEITDIRSAEKQDCIEPLIVTGAAESLVKTTPGATLYANGPGSTPLPPGWSIPQGNKSVASEDGIRCSQGNCAPPITGSGKPLDYLEFTLTADAGEQVYLDVNTSLGPKTFKAGGTEPASVQVRLLNGDLAGSNIYLSGKGRVHAIDIAVKPTLVKVPMDDLTKAVFRGLGKSASERQFATLDIKTKGEYRLANGCRVEDDDGKLVQAFPSPVLSVGEHRVLCRPQGLPVTVTGYEKKYEASCNTLTWDFNLTQGGVAVPGLDKKQLKATANGTDLGAEGGAVLTPNPTARVTLLLDRSFSITDAGASASVREAAKAFVAALPEETVYSGRQFASEVIVPDRSSRVSRVDRSEVETYIDEGYKPYPIATSYSATKLYDAVASAAYEPSCTGSCAQNGESSLQRILLVFSDGNDTASLAADAKRASAQAKACRIKPIAVGLGAAIDKATLSSLAGDDVYVGTTNAELKAAFVQAASNLRGRYRYRLITPQLVPVDGESTLVTTVNGQTVKGTYQPPKEPCVDVEREQSDACSGTPGGCPL